MELQSSRPECGSQSCSCLNESFARICKLFSGDSCKKSADLGDRSSLLKTRIVKFHGAALRPSSSKPRPLSQASWLNGAAIFRLTVVPPAVDSTQNVSGCFREPSAYRSLKRVFFLLSTCKGNVLGMVRLPWYNLKATFVAATKGERWLLYDWRLNARPTLP